jgi:outer membrane receptor for ferrienterochelin and colicin
MVKVILKQFITIVLFILISNLLFGQTGAIKGVVIDKKTRETIIGANVVISGTTIGKSTDLNGEFLIDKLNPGKYTLKISFISYVTVELKDVKVEANKTTNIKVEIEEKSTSIEGVTVVERKKTDTELSIMSSIKQSSLVVSGVSSQQIAKSQDKDASEVIRRIPGITIIDGRFVVVRGLIERYNSVWLNNAATPSSESDTRAFSFDVIPSNMIDRLLVFKTPAPELPADFAGASVQIFTKNIPDQNTLTFGYSAGIQSGTTFNDFYRYKGGKTDWLGFDDGTRDLPSGFPSTEEFNKLGNFSGTPEQIAAQKAEITRLGRSFNKIWTADKMKAPINNSFNVGFTRKFKIAKAEVGTIASINYSNSFDNNSVFKTGYISYDTIKDKPSYSYKFIDEEYSNNVKIGILLNWSILLNKNHSLEFRNIFNQYGNTKTILRSGREYYYSADGVPIKATELGYTSRTTYSGQFGGQHKLFEQNTNIDWTVGYSYANKNQPDNRRTFATFYDAEGDTTNPNYGKYALAITKDANTDYNGRLFKDMFEKIYIGGLNITQKASFLGLDPEFKAGLYVETKRREFNARNIGFTMAKSSMFNIDLFQSLEEIYKDSNINYTNGLRVDEKTNPSDSYKAQNDILAYYLGMKLPIYALFNVYAGLRVENNKQVLNGFDNKTNLPLDITNKTTDLFPSLNITYTITEKALIRFAYGLTVNRPEFREIAPYSYYDFALKSTVYGNDSLKNAYVQNFDLRYELYPSMGEMLNIGFFYKKFDNPIEATLFPTSGSGGWDYLFVNTKSSTSLGAEIDMRKSFASLTNSTNFLKNFRYFTLTLNASYIYSKIVSDASYVRDKERPMQGQSPFIVNTGIYYQNEKGLMVSVLYNVIGKRIMYVGNPNSPHIYEMPFHLLDLSVNKTVNKHLTVKFGVKNLLDDKVIFKQIVTFNKDINNDGVGDGEVEREQITKEYKPGRYFSVGFSYQF